MLLLVSAYGGRIPGRYGQVLFFVPCFWTYQGGIFCLKRKQDVAVNLNALGHTGVYFVCVREGFRLYLLFLQCGWISQFLHFLRSKILSSIECLLIVFWNHFHPDLLDPGCLRRKGREQPRKRSCGRRRVLTSSSMQEFAAVYGWGAVASMEPLSRSTEFPKWPAVLEGGVAEGICHPCTVGDGKGCLSSYCPARDLLTEGMIAVMVIGVFKS